MSKSDSATFTTTNILERMALFLKNINCLLSVFYQSIVTFLNLQFFIPNCEHYVFVQIINSKTWIVDICSMEYYAIDVKFKVLFHGTNPQVIISIYCDLSKQN